MPSSAPTANDVFKLTLGARRWALTVLALALAACQAPGTTGALRHVISPNIVATDPIASPASPSAQGAIASSAPIAAALFSGRVTGPAGLISDHGGGIVSNNGGGVVSNNGAGVVSNNGAGLTGRSGYALLAALQQVPLPRARVEVVDAAGKPVAGPDGRALVTNTDAQGHYAFAGVVPKHNWIVRVPLADGSGAFEAIAPPTQTAAVDVDLISTLTTRYILDRYVASQTLDPTLTLDKLPADVEAATRAKAKAALASGTAAVPDALTPRKVDATVEQLREQDPSLDQQLDAVRKLLVVAGLSDLGNGELATAVPLRFVSSLMTGPGGTLVFSSALDGRIWRLDPDGHLRTLATGVGLLSGIAPVGISFGGISIAPGGASAAPSGSPFVGHLHPMGFDVDGHALIADAINSSGIGYRLYRQRTDGSFEKLYEGANTLKAVWRAGGDRLMLVADSPPSQCMYLTPGQPAVACAIEASTAAILGHLGSSGQDEAGQVHLVSYLQLTPDHSLPSDNPSVVLFGGGTRDAHVYSFDPGKLALAAVADLPATSNADPLALKVARTGARGEVLARRFDGTLVLLGADGSSTPFRPEAASDLNALPDGNAFFALAADGTFYLTRANGSIVTRLEARGGWTAVAGIGPTSDALETRIGGFSYPVGLAVAPGGTLYVSELSKPRIFRVGAERQATAIAGTGNKGRGGEGDGQAALSVDLGTCGSLQLDGSGSLYFLENGSGKSLLRKLDAQGMLSTPYQDTAGFGFGGYAIAPDETLYVLGTKLQALQGSPPPIAGLTQAPMQNVASLLRIAQGKTTTFALPDDAFGAPMAVAADGSVVLTAQNRLYRWTEAAGATLLSQDAKLVMASGGLAIDTTGRIYTAFGKNVTRFDPATQAVTAVAGPGSSNLNGTGVDDSVSQVQGLGLDAQGNLYVLDTLNGQVKRVAAGSL
jgi:sugar lactone lactonase YvrE